MFLLHESPAAKRVEKKEKKTKKIKNAGGGKHPVLPGYTEIFRGDISTMKIPRRDR